MKKRYFEIKKEKVGVWLFVCDIEALGRVVASACEDTTHIVVSEIDEATYKRRTDGLSSAYRV